MRLKHFSLLASASLLGLLASAGLTTSALADTAAALTGHVTSAEEGAMEGVLVSAKKDGSNITVTVVTNEKGDYSFPADRLSAGHYAITIRAAGYHLDGARAVDVTASGSKADLKLLKAKLQPGDLSNAEWLMSVPGSDTNKGLMAGCVSCHTLQRIFTSTHDAEEFKGIFHRMGGYSPGSSPTHRIQPLLPGKRADRSPMPAKAQGFMADWLASVDRNTTDTLPYELKSMPRPKGASTHVIITEYDLPRPETQPHDVVLDKDGMVWYSDFSNMYAGVLDPRTGKATDIPIPVLKPNEPQGSLEIDLEPSQQHVWLAMMYQAGVARIDRLTHEVKTYPFPKDLDSSNAQASMVSPQHDDVDGKVWTNNQEEHHMYRVDMKTGQYENLGPSTNPAGKQISAYGMPTDKFNNVYQLEFGGAAIGYRDAKTGITTIYQTPLQNSKPRRGRVDDQNRLWFAEYGANAIGLFDPQTAAIKEYQLPTKYSFPYDVATNADASEVWTGSMLNDLVARLDTKTGKFTEYLLPRTTNIRRVYVQDIGPGKTAFWAGSNHGASIVKVEPLN